MNRWSALAMLLAIAGALALRAPKLAIRPFHNDEAVNAIKAAELWQNGRYVYDPNESHGPALHYATLPFLWLSGARDSAELKDATLRIVTVVFGIGLILLLPLFIDGLGRHALGWAAVFIAISPAMVFYSRYFIHEMLLVFFTALTLAAGWRYRQTRAAKWALIAGGGVGLMFATKETFVLALAAMVIAGILTRWRKTRLNSEEPAAHEPDSPAAGTPRSSDATEPEPRPRGSNRLLPFRNWKHALLGLSAAFAIWLVMFSSFFTHFTGLADSIRTYLPWLKRAGGQSPHIHPWGFYLERLAWFHPAKGPAWSEGLILVLAGCGCVVSLGQKQSPLKTFLAIYTIVLTAIYSAISYKTPWCLLSFFYGMILLAGIGAAAVVEFFRRRATRAVVIGVLLALAAQLAWQAWRGGFVYSAARRNPYVYAQTLPDILNLVERAEGIARVAPTGYQTVVKVISPESDYWPLPWYLRRFKNVGWYAQLPDDPFAPIMVVSSKLDARLDDKSGRKWIMVGLSELRPQIFFEMYVELDLWKQYVATLPRERE